jgi:pimeloyl-ACP methyl ester carboxylesterase
MDDVRAVMDAVGAECAALLGMSEGGNMSMLFAATYPERTAALLLFGCFAGCIWAPDYPWAPDPEERQIWYQQIEEQWGGSCTPRPANHASRTRPAARWRRTASTKCNCHLASPVTEVVTCTMLRVWPRRKLQDLG